MKASIVWLVRLGVDEGLFNLKSAWAVRLKVGEDAELIDFAQELIDSRHVGEETVEQLEQLAGQALARGAGGPPADDPFEMGMGTKPPMARSAVAKPAAAISLHAAVSGVPAPVAPAPTPVTEDKVAGRPEIAPVGGAAGFPFARVAAMSDATLAAHLRGLLKACAAEGVSDLHLSAGARPFVRSRRALRALGDYALNAEDARRINLVLLAPHQRDLFLERRDLDYALAIDETSRCRVNLMLHRAGPAGAYRFVNAKPPRIDEIGARDAEALRALARRRDGLVLVTGPVGSGKTTTLAALVAEMNVARRDHVLIVEDPIEVVQTAGTCSVTQREIGPHTPSFAAALRGAARQDPDVIVLGELGDGESIELALAAAETGRLVIATVPAADAAAAVERLLRAFPPGQRESARGRLAESLRGVVCQRLLPAVDGRPVLACEVVGGAAATAAGAQRGGELDAAVFALFEAGRVSAETARAHLVAPAWRARVG